MVGAGSLLRKRKGGRGHPAFWKRYPFSQSTAEEREMLFGTEARRESSTEQNGRSSGGRHPAPAHGEKRAAFKPEGAHLGTIVTRLRAAAFCGRWWVVLRSALGCGAARCSMERTNYRHENEVDEFLGGVELPCLPEPAGGGSVEGDYWLLSLRGLLEASDAPLSAEAAARVLGMCVRTLQRHLRKLGTTFRRELKAARGRSLPRTGWRARGRGLDPSN